MKELVLGSILLIISISTNAADDQFIEHGNGTVTNAKTGLMWKKCSEGQKGENCTGTAQVYTWNNAMQYFKQVSFAGYNDWRMPTRKELRTLVYCSNAIPQQEAWIHRCSGKNNRGGEYQHPTINLSVFPKTIPEWYWSSSAYAGHNDYIYSVYFNRGNDSKYGRGNKGYVRLVRGG